MPEPITTGLLIKAGIALGVTAVNYSLSQRNKPPPPRPFPFSFRYPREAPAEDGYGRALVDGLLVDHYEDGQDLHLIYVLSRGACDAIEAVVIDGDYLLVGGRQATGDGGNQLNINLSLLAYTSASVPKRNYKDKIAVWEYLNANGAAHASLDTVPTWTVEHTLDGLSYAHVKLTQPKDNSFYTQAPRIQFLMRGRKITWPGQTTPKWTDNAAAIRHFYHTQAAPQRRRVPASIVNDAAFQSAYDLCNEEITHVPDEYKVTLSTVSVQTVLGIAGNSRFVYFDRDSHGSQTAGDDVWDTTYGRIERLVFEESTTTKNVGTSFFSYNTLKLEFSPLVNTIANIRDWEAKFKNSIFYLRVGEEFIQLVGNRVDAITTEANRYVASFAGHDPRWESAFLGNTSVELVVLPYKEWLEGVGPTTRRYTINGVLRADDPPQQVQAEMDFCWQGYVIEHDGEQYYEPGANISEAHTPTIEADEILFMAGETSHSPGDYPVERLGPTLQERVNGLEIMVDQSEGHRYRPASLTVSNAQAEADDGEPLVQSIGTRQFVNSLPVLQRLGEIQLKRLRAVLNTKAVAIHAGGINFARMELRANNRVRVKDPTGAADFVGRIQRTTADESLTVVLELENDPGTIFGDSFFEPVALAEDPIPLDNTPESPTNLTGEEVTAILHDGTNQVYLKASWDAVGWRTRVRWRIEGTDESAWEYTETRGLFALLPVMVGQTYEFQAQHFNLSGAVSQWVNVPPDTLAIGGDTDAPEDPANLRVIPTIGGYELTWAKSEAEDYAASVVYEATAGGAFDTAVEVGEVTGTFLVRTGLESTDEIQLYVVHRDRSGNASGPTGISVRPLATPTGSVRFSYGNPQIPFLVKGRAITNTDPFVLPIASGGTAPYTYSASGLPSGTTFDPATRAIEGTPDTAGPFVIVYRVLDDEGNIDNITISGNVREPVFAFADSELSIPTLVKGEAIDAANDPFQLPSVSGGTSPYTYTTNALPNGLSFSPSSLQITGTSTVAGNFRLILTATDSDGQSDHFVVEFKIDEPTVDSIRFVFEQPTVPLLRQGEAIDDTDNPFELPIATGGTGDKTYSVSPLPNGFSFDPSTRRITGTSTVHGQFRIVYTATDEDGDRDFIDFTINIREPVFQFSELDLPIVYRNVEIDDTNDPFVLPTVTGGTGPYTYAVSPLPTGLSFNTTNLHVTGTSTVSGQFRIIYTATDADGDRDFIEIPLSILETVSGLATPDDPVASDISISDITDSTAKVTVVLPTGAGEYADLEWGFPMSTFVPIGASGALYFETTTITGLQPDTIYEVRLFYRNYSGEPSVNFAAATFSTAALDEDFVPTSEGTPASRFGVLYRPSDDKLFHYQADGTLTELRSIEGLNYVPLAAQQGLAGVQWSETDSELYRWNGSSWAAIGKFAESDHDHSGTYASESHNHTSDQWFAQHAHSAYALTSHEHSDYAASDHEHSDYATSGHDHSGTYASQSHAHSGDQWFAQHAHSAYSLTSHGHGTTYASQTHNHLGDQWFAQHAHSAYALASHGHSGYATSGHGHSASDVGAATSGHSHSSVPTHTHNYATTGHRHTASDVGAATSGHTHSGYATTGHSHSNYATSSHGHSGFAASNHGHGTHSHTVIVDQSGTSFTTSSSSV